MLNLTGAQAKVYGALEKPATVKQIQDLTLLKKQAVEQLLRDLTKAKLVKKSTGKSPKFSRIQDS